MFRDWINEAQLTMTQLNALAGKKYEASTLNLVIQHRKSVFVVTAAA